MPEIVSSGYHYWLQDLAREVSFLLIRKIQSCVIEYFAFQSLTHDAASPSVLRIPMEEVPAPEER